MTAPLLDVRQLTKRFPPNTVALSDVSFTVGRGEVHCLLGANGAGKSTLLKIIAGAHKADVGSMHLLGKQLLLRSPRDATAAGISMIYQELDLIPDLTVGENLFLGHSPNYLGVLRRQERLARANAALERLGAGFSVNAVVRDLSVANQQLTAIARSLTLDSQLIIMDEPSAALNENELERVFGVIRELTKEGRSVLYVSHRLREVLAIGDRATVLRNGRYVGSFDVQSTTEDELATAIVGEHRSLLEMSSREGEPGKPLLAIRRLDGEHGLRVRDLTVRRGQIVGLTGLNGAGRTSLLKALFGVDSFQGEVYLEGRPYRPRSPRAAIRRGVGLVPEDRKTEGLLLGAALYKNTTLPVLRNHTLVGQGPLAAMAREWLERLDAKFRTVYQPASQLSGGNQQKVVVSKWLLDGSRLLLLDEPSRGLDVGAKADMYELIRELAEGGAAVLVTSSELDELYAHCDSIWVMHEGENIHEFDPKVHERAAILHSVISGRRQAVDG